MRIVLVWYFVTFNALIRVVGVTSSNGIDILLTYFMYADKSCCALRQTRLEQQALFELFASCDRGTKWDVAARA